ncbi:hypothetical protein KI387_015082, partial [Taxus chinensis]
SYLIDMQQELPKTVGRTPCCSKVGLNRGPWTPDEDLLLNKYIQAFGEGRWRTLPKKAGLQRCGKSCRLRWMNYLRPDVKRGYISPDEEDLILRLHRLLGNRWSLIAGRIPGRTDNEIKNYWNTHLSKQLISQGIDPRTHKPLISLPIENPNTITPESSTDKSDPSTVKRNFDSARTTNNQDSDHQVHKKHKVEYVNAMDSLRSSVITTPALNYCEQGDMIDWKYNHVKANHHLFPVIDPADREGAAALLLNNLSINIPCIEALEPGLLSHGCSPYSFINNIPVTPFDIQPISNLSLDYHCNPIIHSAQAPPSTNKMQTCNEYEGYNMPKAEVFIDANGSAINSNGILQVYPPQDPYGSYIDSIVHDHQDLLLNEFHGSLTSEAENPNSSCDLWSLYQYHPYSI